MSMPCRENVNTNRSNIAVIRKYDVTTFYAFNNKMCSKYNILFICFGSAMNMCFYNLQFATYPCQYLLFC